MINEKELMFHIEKQYRQWGNEYDAGQILRDIEDFPKVDEWIPVEERLPEEHDSIFAKLKGTDQWHKGMFEKVSDDVNVTIEYSNGERKTITMHTKDGQWSVRNTFISFKVISWKPLPEPMRKEV